MRVTQITTVKSRRAHVERHLPKWLESGIDELVIVDWDCPQESGKWLTSSDCPASSDPRLAVVRVDQALAGSFFHLCRARNLGALAARHELFFFMDADCWVTPAFIAKIKADCEQNPREAPELWVSDMRCLDEELLDESSGPPGQWVVDGQCVVRNHVFHWLHGFNEQYSGWGGAEYDFYLRAMEYGARIAILPQTGIWPQAHTDNLRDMHLPPAYRWTDASATRQARWRQGWRRLAGLRRHARATPGRRVASAATKNNSAVTLTRGGRPRLWVPGEEELA